MKLWFLLLSWPLFAFAGKVEVQGHRGARWVRPENSIPAFLYAVENGADTLEMDMHVSKDGVIFVTHDPFLSRDLCLDKIGKPAPAKTLIASLTLAKLQSYDCGSRVNRRFPEQLKVPGTRIPTLDDVFTAVEHSSHPNAKTVQFNIETKSEVAHPEFTPPPEEFVKLFLATVRKHGLLSRVTLQSFDYRTLKIAHELEPSLKLSVLVEDKPEHAFDLVTLLKQYNAQILSPNHAWLTPEMVSELHKAGARVIPWTPNHPDDWKRLIAIGVDGIITDNPKALVEYLSHL